VALRKEVSMAIVINYVALIDFFLSCQEAEEFDEKGKKLMKKSERR